MKSESCKNSAVNLGSKEKRKRLMLGLGTFFLAAALSLYFVFEDSPRLLRISVWPLFFVAVLGFFQAKERTCVMLAWKRVRNLDSGHEPIADPQMSHSLMLKSQKIILQAFLLAAALTAACFFS